MGYSYYYTETSVDPAVAAVVSIYLIILVLSFAFWLTAYLLHSFGLYTIAGRTGHTSAWMAFVPFARTYLQGELAGEISLKNRKIKNPGIWFLVMPFVGGALVFIFYIGLIMVIGFGAMAAYNTYSRINSGTVMGMIVFLIIAVLIMLIYSALYQVLSVLINMRIYRRFTTENMSVVHAVLSAVVPLYEAICTFVLRNKEFAPGMEPPVPPRGPAPGPAGIPPQPHQPGPGEIPPQPHQPGPGEIPPQPHQPGPGEIPPQPYQPEPESQNPGQNAAGETEQQ